MNDASSSETASKEEADAYALFDNLLDATIAINYEGIIQYVNNAVTDVINGPFVLIVNCVDDWLQTP